MELLWDAGRYRQEITAAAARVRSVAGTGDAPVPGCPGWNVRDVVGHLGHVHRWAAEVVRTGAKQPQNHDRPPGDDPAAWYDTCVEDLLDALDAADPAAPCWTLGPPRTALFWSRRQAHETAMHALDVEAAVGTAGDYGADLAADGIGEVLTVMMPRVTRGAPVRLPAPLALETTDVDARWVLVPGDDGPDVRTGGPAVATVAGTAQDLLMALWKRSGPTGLTVTGDRTVADALLAAKLTP